MRTAKHADPDTALTSWRRMNRPARTARKQAAQVEADNVVQMPLRLAGAEPASRRTYGSR